MSISNRPICTYCGRKLTVDEAFEDKLHEKETDIQLYIECKGDDCRNRFYAKKISPYRYLSVNWQGEKVNFVRILP